MRRFAFLAALTFAVVPFVAAEAGPRRTEQEDVRKGMRERAVRSLSEIERRVLPTMPRMQYLGPEYDAATRVYRLKFIRDGRVIVVDVDGRSGHILHRSP